MDFRPHKVSVEEYQKRSLAVTKEQMSRLQASQEFDRWERRQSRRFWSALRPSFVEVLVMIATVGLMAGVCRVANVVEVALELFTQSQKLDSAPGTGLDLFRLVPCAC